MAFCPKCGEEAVDVFCESCLREREPLITDVEPIELTKCSTCDRIRIRGKWKPLSAFGQVLDKHVSFNPRAAVLDTDYPQPVIEDQPEEFVLPLLAAGTVSDALEPYEEEYAVRIAMAYEQCDRCSMAHSSYFEGILQLRNPRDEVIDYIDERVQRADDVFITKAVDVNGGIDFYFTDQQYLVKFLHRLHDHYGGERKVESKLHTYDHRTSKKVYRLTCLLRLPDFWTGDVVETNKRLLLVTRMGSTLHGYDLRRRKASAMPYPSHQDALVLDVEDTTVSSVRPEVRILHPDTYQEVSLVHALEARPGDEVRVVQDSRGRWYALPPEKL